MSWQDTSCRCNSSCNHTSALPQQVTALCCTCAHTLPLLSNLVATYIATCCARHGNHILVAFHTRREAPAAVPRHTQFFRFMFPQCDKHNQLLPPPPPTHIACAQVSAVVYMQRRQSTLPQAPWSCGLCRGRGANRVPPARRAETGDPKHCHRNTAPSNPPAPPARAGIVNMPWAILPPTATVVHW